MTTTEQIVLSHPHQCRKSTHHDETQALLNLKLVEFKLSSTSSGVALPFSCGQLYEAMTFMTHGPLVKSSSLALVIDKYVAVVFERNHLVD